VVLTAMARLSPSSGHLCQVGSSWLGPQTILA
jgi:hypothetical protein